MTKENVIALKKDRLAKMKENGKNTCPNGPVRKLAREIRNLEKED